ncbi:hypothetical protein CAPTEDRAFT_219430 [Capitella teleta]|uniref:Peptidase M13 N-terminal domain-containing protein n=1 Tax=Capitella teleta TaxID=283909 RepID=R7VH68_CAPTE|nr:hypothetical protein CAPTEDRAFT_219430 [Capitella teleta]|eukprot:ELU15641.1 hypothetical protein CAPTEDRAFT_219430 [Capitella teleta]
MSKAPIAHTLRQMRAASESYSELSHGAQHDHHASQPGTSTRPSPRQHRRQHTSVDGPSKEAKAKEEARKNLKTASHNDIEFQALSQEDEKGGMQQAPKKPHPPVAKETEVKIVFPSMSPPSVDLTGREVIFAIAVFFFLSVSVGLVVVLVDAKIREMNQELADKAKSVADKLELARNPPREVCVSVDCLRASVHILETMNSSVAPCDNFYEHACGGWISQAKVPSHRHYTSMTKEMEAVVKSRLRSLLEQETNDTAPSAEDKARMLYRRCMDVDAVEEQGVKPFKRAVDAMGGWAITEDWNIGEKSGLWNLQSALRTLSFDYFVQPLFEIVFDVSSHAIKLSPPSFPLETEEYLSNETSPALEAYVYFMEKTARLYGADKNSTQEFISTTLQFEKDLATLVSNDNMMDSFFQGGDDDSAMSMEELRHLSPRIHWIPWMQTAFKNITKDTRVSVPNREFFANLSSLLMNTDERILNYFLMWRFFNDMAAPLMSEQFRFAKGNFDKRVKGTKRMLNRVQFCLKSSNEWLAHAVGAMYVREYFPKKHKNDNDHVVLFRSKRLQDE